MDIKKCIKFNEIKKGMVFKRKSDNTFNKLLNIILPDNEESEFIYMFKGFAVRGKSLFKQMFSKDLQGNLEVFKIEDLI